jgi:nucleotide-binding universal stress UspA family protein
VKRRGGRRKILVTVDFSAESEKALRYAAELAHHQGATLSAIHVVAPVSFCADYGYGPVRRLVPNENAIRCAQSRLRRWGRRIVGRGGLGECIVRSGSASDEIAEAARAANSNLIILGARERIESGDANPSGASEKIVRCAPCPVLVLHGTRLEHAL